MVIRNSLFYMVLLLASVTVSAEPGRHDTIFQPFDALLKDYVKQGKKKGIQTNLVNYKAWSKDKRHLQAMASLKNYPDVAALMGDNKMVFWINTYNLLTIDLITLYKEEQSIKNLGSFLLNPWRKYHWRVAGKDYSLHQIEHEILRPMGDPRIHMAINCASLSCPDLRAEIYTADKLDDQLNDQVKKFLSNDSKGLVRDKGKVRVSKIFKWFEEDFENNGRVELFLNGYLSKPVSDLTYLDYNWQLNSMAYAE